MQSQIEFPAATPVSRIESTIAAQAETFFRMVSEHLPEMNSEVLVIGAGPCRIVATAAPGVAHFCRAFNLGMNGPVAPATLDEVEAFLLPRCGVSKIEVCATAHDSLLVLLRERGYGLQSMGNVFYRPPPRDGEDLTIPAGVRIEAIDPDDAEAAQRVQDVVHRAFVGAGTAADHRGDPMRRLGGVMFKSPAYRGFSAHIDDFEGPVGGGGMEFIDGAANMFGAAVDARARNRGCQLALLRARLEAVRDEVRRGRTCDLCVIQSRPGTASERNILRAGFRLAYGRASVVRIRR